MRVVSLLPSATEILYALGVEPVGVSHSCDYPPAVRGRPTLTSTPVDPDADPATIDDQVLDLGGATYTLDADLLAALEPDLVVTQATCEVCAVDASEVHVAVESAAVGADVLTLDPHSLADVFDDVRRVGAATGREAAAAALVEAVRERVAAVRRRGREGGGEPPRVTVLDWTDPVMVAGHWLPGMVETAGGAFGPGGDGPSRPVEWGTVRAYDPEVLIVAPCGFDRERAAAAVDGLREKPGWRELTAVREGRVFAVDGSGYMNRPGPRLVDSLELLADCLTGEVGGEAAVRVATLPA